VFIRILYVHVTIHYTQVQTELRTHGALQPVPGLLVPTVPPTAAGSSSSTAAVAAGAAAGSSGSASSTSSISGVALQPSLELNQNLDPSKPPALSADMLHEQLAAAGLGALLEKQQPAKVSL
jgi:hypothetical protein